MYSIQLCTLFRAEGGVLHLVSAALYRKDFHSSNMVSSKHGLVPSDSSGCNQALSGHNPLFDLICYNLHKVRLSTKNVFCRSVEKAG